MHIFIFLKKKNPVIYIKEHYFYKSQCICPVCFLPPPPISSVSQYLLVKITVTVICCSVCIPSILDYQLTNRISYSNKAVFIQSAGLLEGWAPNITGLKLPPSSQLVCSALWVNSLSIREYIEQGGATVLTKSFTNEPNAA